MLKLKNCAELANYIGKDLGESDWIAVSQSRIDAFASATEDKQWIHVDIDRARRETTDGMTIAHGYLILSFIPHIQEQIYTIESVSSSLNYGLNRVRFLSPVPAGQRVRGRISVLSVQERPDGWLATYSVSIEGAGLAKPACVAEIVALHFEAVSC